MCILPGSRIVSELGGVAEEAQRRSVVILVWIDTNRQYLVTSPPPPFPPPPVIIPLTTNTFYNKTGGLLQQAVMPHNIALLAASPCYFEVQVNFLTRHYPYQKNIICMDGVFTSILRQCNNYKVSYSPSTFYTSNIPIIQIFSSPSFGPLLNSRIWFIKKLAKIHNLVEQ